MTGGDLYPDRLKMLAQVPGPAMPDRVDGQARLHTPLCGDRVDIGLTVAHGRIAALGHHSRGCLVCRAAATVLAAGAVGRDRAQLAATLARLDAFLSRGGDLPDWPDIDVFAPARAYPSRWACVTLPFRVALAALAAAETNDPALAAAETNDPALAAAETNDPAQVAAVILAAGSSSRMGDTHKLTLPWRGVPMLRHVAAMVAGCPGLDPVLVVVGPGERGRDLTASLAGLDVRVIVNDRAAQGQASSVAAAVAALPADCAGLMVFLADMPQVGPADVAALLDQWPPADPVCAVRPVWRGQSGHPVLLAPVLFGALAALDGDSGARAVLGGDPARVRGIATENPGVVVDIDTPEQYRALTTPTAKG